MDHLLIGYLAFTGFLLLLQRQPEYFLLHGALIGAVLAVRRALEAAPRPWLRLAHAFYGYFLAMALYLELDLLAAFWQGRVFDDLVLSWEARLFGGSPALWLSERLPSYWLSELLHLCYLLYYGIGLGLLVPLLLARRHRELQTTVWTVVWAFVLCYLWFIFFPVEGPRLRFPPIDESLRGPVWHLCHFLSGQGAAAAAAFPSSHVAVSATFALCARRWHPRAAAFVVPIAAGVSLCTVYGRFHYAVDTLAGLAVAWLVTEIGPRLFDWLLERKAPRYR